MEACRNSGQTVSEWCSENGIAVTTYYSWQRKVFETVAAKAEVCFAEVPVYSTADAMSSTAAVLRAGNLAIELCNGADAATIRAIIQAIESC